MSNRHHLTFFITVALLGTINFAYAENKKLPDTYFYPDRPVALKAMEDKPAPPLTLKTWIGEETSIQKSRGKVVVVDFWATWCGPCMASIPKNVKIVEKYKDKGLVFIGVHDANSGWDKADATVKKNKINYPVARDADGGTSSKEYKLAFWPTYVVIDKFGIVRGAGLTPDHVEDAVKLLLDEPGPPQSGADNQIAAGPPVEWFVAGHTRPSSLQQLEGKPAPEWQAEKWLGEPVTTEQTNKQITVVHFAASGNPISMKQAAELAKLELDLSPQGVVFLTVCPTNDDWEAITKAGEAKSLPSHVLCDAKATDKMPTGVSGATGAAYGVRFLPCTIVIDGSGIVRAAGARIDKIKDITSALLSEESPAPAKNNDDKEETTGDGE